MPKANKHERKNEDGSIIYKTRNAIFSHLRIKLDGRTVADIIIDFVICEAIYLPDMNLILCDMVLNLARGAAKKKTAAKLVRGSCNGQ